MIARTASVRRGVPASAAARQIGQTLEQFQASLPDLLRRGFPEADPTTRLFDPVAIDRWCDSRYPHLNSTTSPSPVDPVAIMRSRLERVRHG